MEKLALICQVCGHEEKLEECPECSRYTCQECFNDMNKRGMVGKICLYCEHIFFMPEEVKPTTRTLEEGAFSIAPEPQSDEYLAPDLGYSMDFSPVVPPRSFRNNDARIRASVEVGDRMSDVRMRNRVDLWGMASAPLSPGDIVTEPTEEHRVDLTPYDPVRVSRYRQRDKIIYDAAQGKLWTISQAMLEIEECQGMAHASVRKLFNKWVESGQALVKRRALDHKDAFYVLTDEELIGDEVVASLRERRDGWRTEPTREAFRPIPSYDSKTDWQYQLVKFMLGLGAMGALIFIWMLTR